MLVPMAPNDRWSLDFVSDQLTDGRRFRILYRMALHRARQTYAERLHRELHA
jgi:hypothetical protein